MIQNDAQKHIKNARDILVGKIPDPKSQVDQITLALMYKFMDDMDKNAEELGGKPTFFTGEYKKYAWHNLMDVKVGNQERMNLYDEALKKLPFNEKLPPLFREIFKDAFLPYRDPNTLSLFLKEINHFSYDNSERLGDAFEHLLSVMASQGDAGQFRTPRHIIDFIVKVVDPDKNDTILDPACGTAGFLISAYNHILDKNKKVKPGDKLSPDEKNKLMKNFAGYDISPDMVRLSLVNMYLHGFKQPKIIEYDTLASDSKWNDFYDVILANPPFMSPRGGIKPHLRFEIKANRSEVLFVDYIMEHLTPNGKAGVIVPEGIIFQSANAYKALRKMLVDDNYLYAVVSLPAGVFNPYAGVKTNILFIDKNLAKRSKAILFIKIENDGFDLGAQRRKIDRNDLPQAFKIINLYKELVSKGIKITSESLVKKSKQAVWGSAKWDESKFALQFSLVDKKRVSESDDYNLSGDRYKETIDYSNQKWPIVELGELADFVRGPFGGSLKKKIFKPSGYLVYEQYHAINNDFNFGRYFIDRNKFNEMKRFEVFPGDLLVSCSGTMGKISIVPKNAKRGIINQALLKLTPHQQRLQVKYLKMVLEADFIQNKHFKNQSGSSIQNVASVKVLKKIKIPLPPLKIQKQIVEELDRYQKIIDGAKQVVNNYKPTIKIDAKWKIVKLGEVCKIARGGSPRPIKKFVTKDSGGINWIKIGDVKKGEKYICSTKGKIKKSGLKKTRQVKPGDFILSNSMSFGRPYILKITGAIHDGWLLIRIQDKNLIPDFLYYILEGNQVQAQFKKFATGGVVKNLNSEMVRNIEIPLPKIGAQKRILNKIEEERGLIESNKKIIKIFEQKIKDRIEEIWGKK